MTIEIVVTPCRPRGPTPQERVPPGDHQWPGRFDARHGDQLLVERTRTPFCDGARALLAAGLADPGDRLVMRYAGSESDALISTVGTAAKLTVPEEPKPRLIKWKPHPGVSLAPPMREGVEEAAE
jgi:hypothetical protein